MEIVPNKKSAYELIIGLAKLRPLLIHIVLQLITK